MIAKRLFLNHSPSEWFSFIQEGGRSRIRPLAHLRFFLSLSSYSRHAASAALLCPHGFSIISRSNGLFVKYRNSSPFSGAKKAALFQTAEFSFPASNTFCAILSVQLVHQWYFLFPKIPVLLPKLSDLPAPVAYHPLLPRL